MKCVCKSVVTARSLNVPNFITTKFSKRVMNYVPTVCELVVTMQDDACQCSLCHNWHEQFTRGSCHINKLVRITEWPCFPTRTVTSTLRMAWEVYVEFMSSTRLMHDMALVVVDTFIKQCSSFQKSPANRQVVALAVHCKTINHPTLE